MNIGDQAPGFSLPKFQQPAAETCSSAKSMSIA